MELKEFIKAAITDITDAIKELQDGLANGAVVAPSMPHPISTKTVEQDGANRLIANIDFDVAITVGNVDTIDGNAKAGIQIFSAKISGGNETRTENVSRMTFSIPVIFPTSEVINDSKRAYDERSEAIERDLVRLRRSALLADKG